MATDDIQLSPHFALREFLSSQTAERMGRPVTAPPEVVENLRRLCLLVLEPVRVELGRPMLITSGYRPGWLNSVIGGAKNSSHLYGCAGDVKVVGLSPVAFCRFVAVRDYPFDQCIQEGTWSHVSVARVGAIARRQALTATFGKDGVATYREGIYAV